jgi:type III secretory pathway lipoprotein EscJ
MKKFNWSVLFLVTIFLVSVASCNKKQDTKLGMTTPETSSNQVIDDVKKDEVTLDKKEDVSSDKTTTSQDHLLTTVQFPDYEIIHRTNALREDGGETLFVLVPLVDLELRTYVNQIKNLIKQLVVLDKRPENISIMVFDEIEALEKVYQKANTTDLNVPAHFLANYFGSPSDGVYRSNLVIFPIAPDSNPAVKVRQDTIDFDPYRW